MATAKKTKAGKADRASKPGKTDKTGKAREADGGGALAPGHGGEAAVLAELTAFDELGGEELVGSSLSHTERQLLGRVARFLSTILQPRLLRRAVGAAYSREEHEELWSLFVTASGREQSLSFAFAAFESDGKGGRDELLTALDAFENEWFPKARAILERRAPEGSAARFVQAFFKDLAQQPFGPLVIDSVATFLDRVEALASSPEPGADVVLAHLRARGLTEAKVSATRALVAEARLGRPSAAPPIDPEAWREAQARQEKALRDLQLAWIDWGTTLRPLYSVPEQIQLGLTEVRVRAETPPPAPAPAPTPGGG